MEQIFRWAGYEVAVDLAATRDWYARAEAWGCGCDDCKNFLAQCQKLPVQMLVILQQLSIPAEKTTDLSQLYEERGRHLYDVRYRVAGRILHRPEEAAAKTDPGILINDNEKTFYPHAAKDFPKPCFDLGFSLWLPWVLDKP